MQSDYPKSATKVVAQSKTLRALETSNIRIARSNPDVGTAYLTPWSKVNLVPFVFFLFFIFIFLFFTPIFLLLFFLFLLFLFFVFFSTYRDKEPCTSSTADSISSLAASIVFFLAVCSPLLNPHFCYPLHTVMPTFFYKSV